ncbi:hypothetical protein ASPWEDRAFT_521360 [Aspergillus wentii DTO 134E9]|uniref:Uncharacterized protein n=1 Tax=Aspergillus wentii DTO 134E9 TaxID=1073089 RepID=A0A1L9RLI1_ASPWE|nr:uncharacterized protein ASPWEDRAFT_521360 [Aspergillus wentii DTO 134E9]OJJ35698.1 hypothetical protein ASPWEDRAFT_521360 [Aspergillus wentii DTO 134E9]
MVHEYNESRNAYKGHELRLQICGSTLSALFSLFHIFLLDGIQKKFRIVHVLWLLSVHIMDLLISSPFLFFS